jgi:arylsulfatase A-like enzyme
MGPLEDGIKSNLGDPLPKTTRAKQPPLPLLRNGQVVKRVLPDDQQSLVELYTDETLAYIAAHKSAPFFLYLAHNAVHFPLYPGKKWAGQSPHGLYSDWVEEVDWSVGRILDAVRASGLAERTFVIFTSDNGGTPRAVNTPLRGHKASTWEGGVRVPTIAWWPGQIPAGTATPTIAAMFDVLPTFAALAGAKLPTDRKLDGVNLWPQLTGGASTHSAHETFFYYHGLRLAAVRHGAWKLHLAAPASANADAPAAKKKKSAAPAAVQLYNLDTDIAESQNVAAAHPAVVAQLESLVTTMAADLGLDGPAPGARALGRVETPRLLIEFDK